MKFNKLRIKQRLRSENCKEYDPLGDLLCYYTHFKYSYNHKEDFKSSPVNAKCIIQLSTYHCFNMLKLMCKTNRSPFKFL